MVHLRETIESFVRPLVTICLTLGFVWGFVVSKQIGDDIFANTFAVVIGFWFGTRTMAQRGTDAPPSVSGGTQK